MYGYRHWIYALTEPLTQQVRYVGCCKDPFERFKTHMWAVNRYNPELTEWIAGLRKRTACPGMIVLEHVKRKGNRPAAKRERYWIERYFHDGAPLLNKVLCPGYVRPENTEYLERTVAGRIREACERLGWNTPVEIIQADIGPMVHHMEGANMKIEKGELVSIWPGKPCTVPLKYIYQIRRLGPRQSKRVISQT